MNVIELLRCPKCKKEKLSHQPGKHLTCSKCKAIFPISDGVPRFTEQHDGGFNERWAQHQDPQATTIPIWEDKTPWKNRGDLGRCLILDAGCGIGRFSDVALEYGAGYVISVDAAPAAIASAQKLLKGKAATVMQADLLNLPIASEVFDRAFSLGVLHHTKNTRAAFMEVARTLKPGGELAVWVYCKPVTDDRWLPAIEMLHEITKACPPNALHKIFNKHACKVRDSYASDWNPLAQVLRVSVSKDDEECISDTFDWHTPQYRYWHSHEEVSSWFIEAGFVVTSIEGLPTTVTGVKKRE